MIPPAWFQIVKTVGAKLSICCYQNNIGIFIDIFLHKSIILSLPGISEEHYIYILLLSLHK
jgi:hypothetical protein